MFYKRFFKSKGLKQFITTYFKSQGGIITKNRINIYLLALKSHDNRQTFFKI